MASRERLVEQLNPEPIRLPSVTGGGPIDGNHSGKFTRRDRPLSPQRAQVNSFLFAFESRFLSELLGPGTRQMGSRPGLRKTEIPPFLGQTRLTLQDPAFGRVRSFSFVLAPVPSPAPSANNVVPRIQAFPPLPRGEADEWALRTVAPSGLVR